MLGRTIVWRAELAGNCINDLKAAPSDLPTDLQKKLFNICTTGLKRQVLLWESTCLSLALVVVELSWDGPHFFTWTNIVHKCFCVISVKTLSFAICHLARHLLYTVYTYHVFTETEGNSEFCGPETAVVAQAEAEGNNERSSATKLTVSLGLSK